jgi:HSP20 family molecular chaperone IbpA
MNMRDIIPWGRDTTSPTRFEIEQSPFLSLHRELNWLFDDVFRGFDVQSFGRLASFGGSWPKLEITDTDKEVRVSAEVPGMDEKDIEVTLDDGYLTLRRTDLADRGQGHRFVQERRAHRDAAEDRTNGAEVEAHRDQRHPLITAATGADQTRARRIIYLVEMSAHRLCVAPWDASSVLGTGSA